ncbi:MAG: 16S rRNA (cytosine(967)-C(5))-methyltransferase RsmB, partial [Xanthomonadales bacterium]|nr:16S rRNA (cytosine(967)-C(5))-methyltransferase RsmB [Xanthomonadales bacterium]
WIAGSLLDRPLKRRDQDIHRLILAGLFELWKGDSGEHAAVFETASCARLLRKTWAVGVINAVLRRFQREQAEILESLDRQDARFAHPAWLLDHIRSDWPDHWQAIAEANNRPAGLWLRINRQRSNPDAMAQAMDEAGFDTHGHDHARDGMNIIPPAPVEQLPGYAEGLWSVQDPAAQLAASWLDPQPGQRVLDACAAPGGKTCHLLEYARDTRVWALDQSDARLERLRQNVARLGFSEDPRLTITVVDATHPESWWDGVPFERILLDAPCTATGVIRRHPEIKWLRNAAQVDEAITLQARLLRSLWPLLKAGGILVYATCSVLRDENSKQISRFIEEHGDARPEPRDVSYGQICGAGRQILPGEADMDGFYYARVRKLP